MQASHYNFEVTPTVKNGKVASWELCFVGPRTPHNKLGCGEDADVYVPMNQSNQSFKYTIKGDPGLGLVFAPNPPAGDGPIWIAFDYKPKSPFVEGEIKGLGTATKPHGGQNNLNFVDKNDTEGILQYQLNFVDRNGNKSELDPDIINGGKGRLTDAAFLIAAGVALALLALWTLQVIAARRARPANPAGADNDKRAG